jgi:uroporphyrinogen-III synthase
MKPLVILRPEPGASATAEAARQCGLDPVVMPLFEVRSVEWEVLEADQFDGLLLTSANAIRHGGAGLGALRILPAHCVGEATARAAREAGFTVASVGSGRVDSLLQSLPDHLRLLHLCGFHRREPMSPRQAIHAVPVYRSDEKSPSDGFGEIEGSVVAIHSPRAGSRFSLLVDEFGLSRGEIEIAAISPEAAEAAGSGWEAVAAAEDPSDGALLAIAARLCNKPG